MGNSVDNRYGGWGKAGLTRTLCARKSLITPHPLGTLTERLELTGARDRIPIKTYVLATGGPQPTPFIAMAERIASDPSWRLEKLACGHNTMMEMPQETLEVLLRAAS